MQTSHEHNLSSNMLLLAKQYIPYELCDLGFNRAETPSRNLGIAAPDIDGPALLSKYPWCSSLSHKPDLVYAEQFIVTAGKALFPALEHNLEVFVGKNPVHEANQAPISYLLSEGRTVPISYRHLDFNIDIDISSNWYSLNECNLVGMSDQNVWRFQYDFDLLETHLHNVTLSNSLDEEKFCHAQIGTSYPVIFDSATDCNLFKYKNISKLTQLHTSVNHTEDDSKSSHYMDASEDQAGNQEHRAHTSDYGYRDMKTSSASVITPLKATLGSIPDLVSFSHRKLSKDSNAYIGHIAEARTKNEKDVHFEPNMDSKDDDFDPDIQLIDYLEDFPCMNLITTSKSVHADNDDDTDSQLSTSFEYESSQLPLSTRINLKVHAQSYKTESASDSSTPNGFPCFSTNRVSLKWRPVVFNGMNEIKQSCEAPDEIPDKRSRRSKEILSLEKHDLDKFWKRLNKNKCYVCLYENCMQRFDRLYNARTHIKTHMDVRQFRCKICFKRYVRRHDLNRHTKLHTSSFDHKPTSEFNFHSFRLNALND